MIITAIVFNKTGIIPVKTTICYVIIITIKLYKTGVVCYYFITACVYPLTVKFFEGGCFENRNIFVNRVLGESKMNSGIFGEAVFGVIKLKMSSWFKKYPDYSKK